MMSTVVNITATDTDNTNDTGDDDDDDDDEDDDAGGGGGRAVIEELHRELLGLIRNDDALAVRELLDGHAELDVNAKDYRGVTGLGVAVEAGSESVVDLLLSRQPRPDVGDSLMRAISEGQNAIAEKLLDVLQSSERPESAQLGYGDSAEYPPHLTPLMLAAQCGNFRIVGLLLDRGHAIPEPHEPRCMCKEVSRPFFTLLYPLSAPRGILFPPSGHHSITFILSSITALRATIVSFVPSHNTHSSYFLLLRRQYSCFICTIFFSCLVLKSLVIRLVPSEATVVRCCRS